MSWSSRYRSLSYADTADTVDTVEPPPEGAPYSVNTVNCVRAKEDLKTVALPDARAEAIEAAFDAEERAAIIAEGGCGDARAKAPHDMPPSWADTTITPTAGARCRGCGGKDWWREATGPRGWRCAACHPGDRLPADRRRMVTT